MTVEGAPPPSAPAPRPRPPAAGEPVPVDFDALVGPARLGDRAALEDLLRASYDYVLPVCRRMIGDDGDAADACQETLISVVRALPRFDGRSRYTTWLYRIAVNAALDELRRRGRRPVPAPEDPTRPTPGGVESVAAAVDVGHALLRLPVEFRAAVVLRDLCGLDYDEIATVLAVPPGTVRSRIARGRGLLVGLLAPSGEDG